MAVEFKPQNFRLWSVMGVNPALWSIAFPEIIDEENTVLLTADLARYSGLVRTASNHPQIFYNVGIAEQNMVGVAAGLALCGHDVYMTTYAPFILYRCFDQVRHLMGNMNLNIKAIGSAAGFTTGKSGASLLAISDIAAARAIPNLTVLQPADCTEAVKMMLSFKNYNKPVYMRFCGNLNIPCVYKQDYNFEIGKGIILQKGERVALIATGFDIVKNSLDAANKIKEKYGFYPEVINIHTIKPIDEELIQKTLTSFDMVFTIEEHNVIGGLGSAVSEIRSKLTNAAKVKMLGIQDCQYKFGNRKYMLSIAGLDSEGIFYEVEKEIL